MDALSNVLKLTQVGHTVLCESELTEPFGLAIDTGAKMALHVVRRGLCWLTIEGEAPLRLVAGDLVLIGQGIRHGLSDAPDTPLEAFETALARLGQRPSSLPVSGEGTALFCAAYAFEQGERHPVLGALPRLIRLRIGEGPDDGDLEATLRLLAREAQRRQPGADIVVPRLVDALFVLVMRAWLARSPAGMTGWLGALNDAQIGRALALMHDDPARRWTVEALARAVALSRAAFARRFAERMGEGPLTYLARWRMGLAAQLLKTSGAPIDRVAADVGYESAAAFGKAFQRHLAVSPGEYRRAARDA